MNSNGDSLTAIACTIRNQVIELSFDGRTPHLGSALSCVDILVALFWRCLKIDVAHPDCGERDRFVFSKGHAAAALYATLAERGFFPKELLGAYAQAGSCLPEHPSRGLVPGVEVAAGSLGHGLPMGLGMAWAGRLQGSSYRVFVLMSDGECNEGSVWEAALFAPAQKLDQVTTIIDYNKWQATGRSNEVMALAPLRQKWEAFGWEAIEVDGHDLEALSCAFEPRSVTQGKPLAVIAHTTKGKGISFMEDNNNWHYRIPSREELEKARKELAI